MKLIIMRGISGSGKSTYAEGEYPEAIVCSADDYFIDPETGEYEFDPAGLTNAHTECFEKCLMALEGQLWDEDVDLDDKVVVVDNTNLSRAEYTPYVMLGRMCGFDIELVRMLCPVELAADRNVHGVPPNGVGRQAARFEDRAPFDPPESIVKTGSYADVEA